MRMPAKRFSVPRLIGVLLMVAVPGRAAEDSPRTRLAKIEAEQKVAFERYVSDLQKVERTEAAQRSATDHYLAELRQYVESALGLADANPDDPAALEALMFVIRKNKAGPGDATARALRMFLERDYASKPHLGAHLTPIAILLFQYPDAERVLRRILHENPNHDEKGIACYWLATYLSRQAKMVRMFRDDPVKMRDYEKYTAALPIATLVREKEPAALDREASAMLDRVVAEFGDVPMNGDARKLGTIAAGEQFAMRNLSVGNSAPEVAGSDHDGRTFKLSDFRGKVVVLTFSGNWCGPCVGMYPQERALVARLKGEPFALVSVSTDSSVETLKESIASGEITWRCWWDRGTDGPITTRWGISGFPAIFVLDGEGIIRFKDVRDGDLDRAVALLMKDAASPAK